jgi:predicted metal-dependent hydrolase
LNEAKILDRLNQQDNKVPLYNENSMEIFGKTYCCKCFYNQKTNKYNIDDDIIEIDFVKDYYDKVYIEKIYKDLLLTKIKSLYQELYLDISKHFCIDNIIFKTQLMKSRYGSCIPKKRIIKLNSILARFDEVYIKVILIHELIHLEEHNHQKGFYEYINSWIPNYRSYIKEINSLTRKYVI